MDFGKFGKEPMSWLVPHRTNLVRIFGIFHLNTSLKDFPLSHLGLQMPILELLSHSRL